MLSNESNHIDPYTDRAAEHLEDGFQNAMGGFTIDIAEIRESIDDPEIEQALNQAEYCLNRAKLLWSDRYVEPEDADAE